MALPPDTVTVFSADTEKDCEEARAQVALQTPFHQDCNCLPRSLPTSTRILLDFHWLEQGHIDWPPCKGSEEVENFKWAP